MTARKRTRFVVCERHAFLERETRQRRAEFFVEGGPTNAPCSGGRCRLWAGTDLFVAEVCVGEYPLGWRVNEAYAAKGRC